MQMEIFPYSVFYIFFEQYLDIWRTALINISIGLGKVSHTSAMEPRALGCPFYNVMVIYLVLVIEQL